MKLTLLKNRITGERRIYNSITKEYTSENDNPVLYAELRKKAINNHRIASRNQCLKDLGLNRVYGAVSGKVYWE